MFRIVMTLCLSVMVAGSALAENVNQNFSNPSSVNLLECWNPVTGDYGLRFEATCTFLDANNEPREGVAPRYTNTIMSSLNNDVRIANIVSYVPCGSGFAPGNIGDNRLIELTFYFDDFVTIDRLVSYWRAPDHAPSNYQWVDSQGNVIAGVPFSVTDNWTHTPTTALADNTRLVGGMHVDVLNTPVTTNSITFRIYLDGTNSSLSTHYHNAGLGGLGVYLADVPGQSLSMMNGAYNILYEEKKVTGDCQPGWINQSGMGGGGSKPGPLVGSCEWEFSQVYELYGLIMPQFDSARYLGEAKLEVSLDGETWDTVWYREKYYWLAGDDAGRFYIPLDDVGAQAKFLRFSWDNSTNYVWVYDGDLDKMVPLLDGNNNPVINSVDITQFQLFGKPYDPIPEPATMTLLALGGVALLRRRR